MAGTMIFVTALGLAEIEIGRHVEKHGVDFRNRHGGGYDQGEEAGQKNQKDRRFVSDAEPEHGKRYPCQRRNRPKKLDDRAHKAPQDSGASQHDAQGGGEHNGQVEPSRDPKQACRRVFQQHPGNGQLPHAPRHLERTGKDRLAEAPDLDQQRPHQQHGEKRNDRAKPGRYFPVSNHCSGPREFRGPGSRTARRTCCACNSRSRGSSSPATP